ncbi:UrcA family protein [uncultured Sphingomonas sp.]|uniref:UrcA family protein n=1 Tax=uncultured Sphingomonas sp. TaxID=158754 RepID=UPI002601BBD8|nr:UrcA family protein [uncultured Sphingomonas sp.]
MVHARHLPTVLLALALAVPAAADPGATTSVRVIRPTAATPGAARIAERRIADAALEVCGASPFSVAEAKTAVAHSRCWHDSYARGIAQLHGGAPARVASLPPSRTRGEP